LAQPATVYRVGVCRLGGPYLAAIDGLKDGLKDLGFFEGKHDVLEIRDLKGVRKTEEDTARSLERGRVNLIHAIPTTIAAAAKRATTEVPIVFGVGSGPVAAGLVEGFPRPGGRATGVRYLAGELTAKRLQLLKAMLAEMRRIVTFYTPTDPIGVAGVKAAREVARQLKIGILERPVASVEEQS
jgi:putative tryptophan/tyrosine transport system substrate-binding protein